MSVPTWKRNLSDVQFLEELLKLNVDMGRIVANKPKKYKQNYGDFLIKECLEALKYAQVGNDIYLTEDTPVELQVERRRCFELAIGITDNISTTASIFLELTKDQDDDKVYKQEADIGRACKKIKKLISGVIKSDKKFMG